MKKLNKEELEKIAVKRFGYRNNPVLDFLKTISVGEGVIVTRTEWKKKTKPGVIISGTFRDGRRFSTRQLADESGWLIVRLA